MRKIKKSWLIIAAILLGVAFFSIKTYIDKPQNLGVELKYVGSESLGCWPGPIALFCEASPYGYYYYSTALIVDQLEYYFKNARLVEKKYINENMVSSDLTRTELTFQSNLNVDEFTLSYFDKPQKVSASVKLEYKGENLIGILDSEYKAVQMAIE